MHSDQNNYLKKRAHHLMMGQFAEELAISYLQEHGLKLIHHQYRLKIAEIDLILIDQREIVFVEVRYRAKSNPVDPLETIDVHKQRKIILAAEHYLQRREWTNAYTKRFDVITILGNQLKPKITWIRDAFGVE